MAAVALQRELDAYADAIEDYNRQARNYKTSAAKHNASVDAYKQYVEQKTAGNFGDSDSRVFYLNKGTGEYIAGDMSKVLKPDQISNNYYVRELPKGNSYGKYVLIPKQKGDMPSPGEFTMEQPTAPGAAPAVTAAQLKKLDQPSLIDIERNQPSGLISSQFNV
jgi:hypothetical protein